MNNYTIDELRQKGKKDLIAISEELIKTNEELRISYKEQQEKLADLDMEVKRLKSELDNKDAVWEDAGSLAEYSVKVNHLMETAQETANMYLENIKSVSAQKSKEAQQIVTDAEQKANKIMEKVQGEANQIKASSTAILEHLKTNVDKSLKEFEEKFRSDPED